MKKLKSENPCSMGILTRGGGQAEQSRGTCVSKWRVERATGKPRFGRKRERRRLTRGAVVITVNQCFVGTRQCDKQASTTMPPLRLERECKEHSAEQNDLLSFCERRNSATIDYRCVEFDRREATLSTAIMGLRALGQCLAFTMAEILLSLTIIGVVAAITLPSLTGNINERTWNTQRKALYARFSQAIALMPALNGYGTLTEDESGSVIEDTATETFITAGLSKVLKINNICDSEHLKDCGLSNKVTDLYGSTAYEEIPKTLTAFNSAFNSSNSAGEWSYVQTDTKTAAFETANGESILAFYNPYCQGRRYNESPGYEWIQPYMCANFVFDLNGSKGPNTMGKDIGFISVLYPSDSMVVMPVPDKYSTTSILQDKAGNTCRNLDENNRIPNKEELAAMFINRKLLTNSSGFVIGASWASDRILNRNENLGYIVSSINGAGHWTIVDLDTTTAQVWCVKR